MPAQGPSKTELGTEWWRPWAPPFAPWQAAWESWQDAAQCTILFWDGNGRFEGPRRRELFREQFFLLLPDEPGALAALPRMLSFDKDLTSRADNQRTRLASCGVAALYAAARRRSGTIAG